MYVKILTVQLNSEEYVKFMLDSHDGGYKRCLVRHVRGDKHRAEFSLSFPKEEIGLLNKIN